MSSTLAGNLTITGSVANIIVVERAAAEGVDVGFGEYDSCHLIGWHILLHQLWPPRAAERPTSICLTASQYNSSLDKNLHGHRRDRRSPAGSAARMQTIPTHPQ